MPMLFLLFVIPTANLMVLAFLGYYLWQLRNEKKALEDRANNLVKKEVKVDSDYHQIVDSSLSKERKILDDATKEASSILTNTKFVSDSSKETIDRALQKMIESVQQDAAVSSNDIMTKHKNSLSQMSGKSIDNFQSITKQFEMDMQKQMQEYRETLLPNLQKEIEAYKQQKFKEADKTVNSIVQQVSQKVLNKAISLEDHQNLIIESLDKALKEGIFN